MWAQVLSNFVLVPLALFSLEGTVARGSSMANGRSLAGTPLFQKQSRAKSSLNGKDLFVMLHRMPGMTYHFWWHEFAVPQLLFDSIVHYFT